MGVGYASGGAESALQCYFNNGTFFQVKLDMANYHEGQDATGSISFELTQNTPPIAVYVSIIGREYVMWKRRVRRGKSTRIVTTTDSAECCSQRFMIMQSQDSFLPGQYTYPFSFKVPAGVPGTYVHSSGYYSNRAEATVTYSVYCELVTQTDTIGRAQCPIVIMQEARTPYNYNLLAEIDKKVTTWCCCNKGQLNLKCTFEKDTVRMDESVMMRFSLDLSNFSNTVTTFKCELQRKLQLRSKSGLSTYRKHSVISLPVNGVEAGEKTDQEKIVQFDLSQALDMGTPANLVGALGDFAGKIQQTCNGQLITSQYELYVTAMVDGCICCEQLPYVFTPIEVLAPQRVSIQVFSIFLI